MPQNICDVPKCDRAIPAGRGTKGGPRMCGRCLGALSYAKKHGKGWLAEYTERLQFRVERAEYVEPLIGRILKRARQRVADARARVAH